MSKWMYLVLSAGLAGCSGGNDGITSTSVALKNGDAVPGNITSAAPTKNILGFTAADDGTDSVILYSATSEDTYVRIAASTTTVPAPFAGQEYARLGVVTLPSGGTATYTGEYIGVLQNRDAATPDYTAVTAITGDVALTAFFSESTVSGNITDRQTYAIFDGTGPTADALTDVSLGKTSIQNNATFSGTTSGGKYTNPPLTPMDASGELVGTYSGLFGGGDGSVVAGSVSIAHDYTTTTSAIEEGVFIAND